jgi:hypothetical protein
MKYQYVSKICVWQIGGHSQSEISQRQLKTQNPNWFRLR